MASIASIKAVHSAWVSDAWFLRATAIDSSHRTTCAVVIRIELHPRRYPLDHLAFSPADRCEHVTQVILDEHLHLRLLVIARPADETDLPLHDFEACHIAVGEAAATGVEVAGRLDRNRGRTPARVCLGPLEFSPQVRDPVAVLGMSPRFLQVALYLLDWAELRLRWSTGAEDRSVRVP